MSEDVKYIPQYIGGSEYGKGAEYALRPLPKEAQNLGFRLVSDGTPTGTHVVVYKSDTGEEVGLLGNVQQIKFSMSCDDILCDVEMLCTEVPMRLEFGKAKYAIGSADPITVHRLEKTGL